jgi:hypothetical protein
VRAWKKEQVFEGRVNVGANAVRAVRWDELASITLPLPSAKGDLVFLQPVPQGPSLVLEAGFGVRRQVASDLVGQLPNFRVGARYSHWALDIDFSKNLSKLVTETLGIATGGYRLTTNTGRLHAWIAGEVTGGFVAQSFGTTTASTGIFGIGAGGGVAMRVVGSVQVGLSGQLPLTWMEKDGETGLYPLPGAWLGVSMEP